MSLSPCENQRSTIDKTPHRCGKQSCEEAAVASVREDDEPVAKRRRVMTLPTGPGDVLVGGATTTCLAALEGAEPMGVATYEGKAVRVDNDDVDDKVAEDASASATPPTRSARRPHVFSKAAAREKGTMPVAAAEADIRRYGRTRFVRAEAVDAIDQRAVTEGVEEIRCACGHQLKEKFLFCPSCGRERTQCHSCGSELVKGSSFCVRCGNRHGFQHRKN